MVEEIKGRLVRKVADKLLDKLLDGGIDEVTLDLERLERVHGLTAEELSDDFCKAKGIVETGKRYKLVVQPPHAYQTVPRSYYEHSGQVVTVAEENDEGYVVVAGDGAGRLWLASTS